MPDQAITTLHGTAVAMAGRGVLITGAPGSGKSTLAFEMLALGADLVSDDRVEIRHDAGRLVMSAPGATSGMIEARQVGLIAMSPLAAAPLELVVDLDRKSDRRLPSRADQHLLGHDVPVIFGRERVGLAAILSVLLARGTLLDPDDEGSA